MASSKPRAEEIDALIGQLKLENPELGLDRLGIDDEGEEEVEVEYVSVDEGDEGDVVEEIIEEVVEEDELDGSAPLGRCARCRKVFYPMDEVLELADDEDEAAAAVRLHSRCFRCVVCDCELAGQAYGERSGVDGGAPEYVCETCQAAELARKQQSVREAFALKKQQLQQQQSGSQVNTEDKQLNPEAVKGLERLARLKAEREAAKNQPKAAQAEKEEPYPYKEVYSLAELQQNRVHSRVDRSRKEDYLSEADFLQVFGGADRDTVRGWQAWKVTAAKKKFNLF